MKNTAKYIIIIFIVAIFLSPSMFAQLGITPDKDKTHKVVKDDTLANLSFKYYTKDDRDRGAHWIHIYEYSVEKEYINPKTQPIKPYGKNDAFVKLFIDKKVIIPIYNGKYPDANALLNKYGFQLGKDGVSVEMTTGIPINVDIENKE